MSFETGRNVFDDPNILILPDRIVDGEQRWHAIGPIGFVTVLLVVHAYPNQNDDELVRIIGARKATTGERRRYDEEGT